jgi:hypothetical protein
MINSIYDHKRHFYDNSYESYIIMDCRNKKNKKIFSEVHKNQHW